MMFYILMALLISDNQKVLHNQRSIIQAETNILDQFKKNYDWMRPCESKAKLNCWARTDVYFYLAFH